MAKNTETVTVTEPPPITPTQPSIWRRLRNILWDSLDYSPEERKFISKIDFFILYEPTTRYMLPGSHTYSIRTWSGFAYFSKNLNSNNLCMVHSLTLHVFY